MMKKQPSSTNIFQRYWAAYGGWKEFKTSYYSNFSVLFTMLIYPLWAGKAPILDIAKDVLPSLLGFTLGGYAMFLAFGDREFLTRIAHITPHNQPNAPQLYRAITSSFVHFIIIQILALLWALTLDAYIGQNETDPFASWIGHYIDFTKPFFLYWGGFLFVYSLSLLLAVTMHLFRFSTWYEKSLISPSKN